MRRTPNKLSLHDIVRVKGRGDFPPAAIRDVNEYHPSGKTFYLIRTLDGQELELPEDDLEATGEFESPLRYDEVVEINPVQPTSETITLIGQRAVVNGIAVDDERKEWGFSVVLQNDECWYFTEHDLKSMGIFLTPEVFCQTVFSGNPE